MTAHVGTPRLTVAICTHNRYKALRDTVQTLLASRGFARADCELLVIENTPPALRRPIPLPDDPNVRAIVCDTQGLSHARNHAVRHARGEIIAFLDDDALVCDDWCDNILARMAGGDLLAVGGKVAPHYGGEAMPVWYDDSLAGHLSCIDWSPTPRFLRAGEWVVGANLTLHRGVFDTYGLFDTDLGRRGTHSLLSNEESALLGRVGLNRVFYDPAIAVQHVIPTERLTTRWFRRRVYWQAVSDLVAGTVEPDDPAHRVEYGAAIARLEGHRRNLNALLAEPADAAEFKLQLRAIYLAAIVFGGGGPA